jgi:cytochrome c-type biogenesis protein
LAFLYSIGIGLPFIAIAAGFGWATKSVSFVKKHIRSFNIAGGVMLILLGIALATGLWIGFASWIQGVFGVFTPAL